MKILHFRGEGKGWMTGVTEYIVITEDEEPEDYMGHKAPGFELDSITECNLPHTLPLETTLVPK